MLFVLWRLWRQRCAAWSRRGATKALLEHHHYFIKSRQASLSERWALCSHCNQIALISLWLAMASLFICGHPPAAAEECLSKKWKRRWRLFPLVFFILFLWFTPINVALTLESVTLKGCHISQSPVSFTQLPISPYFKNTCQKKSNWQHI